MAVGIVRRIDELGRIVIPKEMRKTMRLQVGDEMEISSNGEGLTLKRYSGFQSVLPACKAVAKSLAQATDSDVLFANANDVVIAEGKNKKQYQNAKLSDSFSNLIRKRREEILHGDELCKIFESVECLADYVVVQPVSANGDFIGCAMLMVDGLPSDVNRAYLHFCAELIGASFAE